jgi:HK97 family phage major capsid protein
VLARLVDERDRVNQEIDDILGGVEAEQRDPSDAERALLTRQRARLAELEPQIVTMVELEEQRAAARDAHQVLDRAAHPTAAAASGVVVATVQPTQAEVIYRSFAMYARDELIRRYDQIATRAGMGERERAVERLNRAVANTTTADIPGLLPPTWLTEIMQVINRQRPVVESSRRINLTSGKLHYPRITQRPIVSKQGAEKTETPSQKMTVIMVEKVASTFLGAGDLSWQAINWSTPDALALWFDLAAEAYAKATEADTCTLLTTVDTLAPIVVAANDLPSWYAAFTQAAIAVYNATGRRVNTIYASMDVAGTVGALVSDASPVFMTTGGFSLATLSGNVAGLALVSSAGFPAGTCVVGDASALLTAETAGAPIELRAVEPSIGGMEVGVIGAFLSELIEDPAFVQLTAPVAGMLSLPEPPAPPAEPETPPEA